MDEQKVFEYRGVEDLVIAEVTSDTAEEFVTGPVETLFPVAEIGKTTDQSKEVKHYDNKAALIVSGEGADELSIIGAGMTLEKKAKITGKYYDPTTGAMIGGPSTERYFAVGYKTNDTDGFTRYVWRYKGMFSIPDENNKTKDNSAEGGQTELTYTSIYTNHKFAKGKYNGTTWEKAPVKDLVVSDREGLANLETFFDLVTTPDTLTAKAKG